MGGRNDESAGTWSRRSTASISEKGKKNRRIMRLPANWAGSRATHEQAPWRALDGVKKYRRMMMKSLGKPRQINVPEFNKGGNRRSAGTCRR
ncbi:hypothetical protein [Rhizobium leguminosarum]|uniref:hypothetical protein n=1 Tax=Rhizobium leguminosarum TaxID=384 RepID=UPI001C916938|nr:hypothetical protein [Rhizobium leguminosarum]MBY2935982.1 hypothetical protein [Rhizobium leguminosarum]